MRTRLPLIVCAFLLTVTRLPAIDWEVRRFDGRDYVRLEKVAEFYELPSEATRENNTALVTGGRRSLRITKDRREATINGVNYWLSFPAIDREGHYWISRMDVGKTIEPAFRPELIQAVKPFTTVVIDPGHGGHDKGSTSTYEYEKNFTLDVARRLRDELQKSGLRVVMTRNSDTFVGLPARASIANGKANCIFVSLHFNASPNTFATGAEIFCVTPRGSPSTDYDDLLVRDMVQEAGNVSELQSLALAGAIYHALQGSPLTMFDRGVKRARFAVLRLTRTPGVLIEGGFLSNSNDARLIASKEWRDKYVRAIATGILEYKKLAELRVRPRTIADYRNPPAPASSVAAMPSPASAPLLLRDLPEAKPE